MARNKKTTSPDILTSFERQLMRWVALALSDGQIAAKLHKMNPRVTPGPTARSAGLQVAAIIRKVGARSRRGLALYYVAYVLPHHCVNPGQKPGDMLAEWRQRAQELWKVVYNHRITITPRMAEAANLWGNADYHDRMAMELAGFIEPAIAPSTFSKYVDKMSDALAGASHSAGEEKVIRLAVVACLVPVEPNSEGRMAKEDLGD